MIVFLMYFHFYSRKSYVIHKCDSISNDKLKHIISILLSILPAYQYIYKKFNVN